MLSLHTNAAALSTQNALASNNKSLTSSMTKLGTGFRINSAMDDAAGLQIANRLKAQNSGMAVAMRNTQNGISLMQTAEGALNEVNTMLVRMKDLATQSADASASAADKEAMQAEYDSLAAEITNIMGNTTFGGEKLLNSVATDAQKAKGKADSAILTAKIGDASAGLTKELADLTTATATAKGAFDAATTDVTRESTALAWQQAIDAEAAKSKELEEAKEKLAAAKAYDTVMSGSPTEGGKFSSALNFQIGATGSETMELNLSSTLEDLHAALGDVSKKYTPFGIASSEPGTELTTSANAMIDKLQTVLDNVGEMRSALGAASNRLEHTNSNLGNMSATTSAAIGRIMDVDYASETSNMTKNQMLMQASSAMLKQSNSMSQMVASLLQ